MKPSWRQRVEGLRAFFRVDLWRPASDPRSAAGRARRLLQLMAVVWDGFVHDRLLLRASALTYFMVLSIVPLFALMIGIAGAVGVRGEAMDRLLGQVVQLIAANPEATEKLRSWIENASFGALGGTGAVFLFVTTVLGISNIERSLNHIWGVQGVRSWSRRFPDYLAVLVVAPLLGVVALSLAGTLRSQWVVQQLLDYQVFSLAYELGLRHVPVVVLAFTFAFLYWFLPNTKVKVGSALIGGAIAAILVVAAQSLYLNLSIGVARASAMFGTFAFLPLLFLWMYVFWAVVLLGAEIAFAHQNLESYRQDVRGAEPTQAQREAAALHVAVAVARAFRDGAPPRTASSLAAEIGVSVRTVREVLAVLGDAGLVAERASGDEDPGFLLARPTERIAVADLVGALRGAREPMGSSPVESLVGELEEAVRKGPGGRSLAEVLEGLPPRKEPEGAQARRRG